MLRRRGGEGQTVICIACGRSVERGLAREYDKHGDRWERRGKTFEYLCKSCDQERCHQPRGDLERFLGEVERRSRSKREFLTAFCTMPRGHRDSAEDVER